MIWRRRDLLRLLGSDRGDLRQTLVQQGIKRAPVLPGRGFQLFGVGLGLILQPELFVGNCGGVVLRRLLNRWLRRPLAIGDVLWLRRLGPERPYRGHHDQRQPDRAEQREQEGLNSGAHGPARLDLQGAAHAPDRPTCRAIKTKHGQGQGQGMIIFSAPMSLSLDRHAQGRGASRCVNKTETICIIQRSVYAAQEKQFRR